MNAEETSITVAIARKVSDLSGQPELYDLLLDPERNLNACAKFEGGMTWKECRRYDAELNDPRFFVDDLCPAREFQWHSSATFRCLAYIATKEASKCAP